MKEPSARTAKAWVTQSAMFAKGRLLLRTSWKPYSHSILFFAQNSAYT